MVRAPPRHQRIATKLTFFYFFLDISGFSFGWHVGHVQISIMIFASATSVLTSGFPAVTNRCQFAKKITTRVVDLRYIKCEVV
jgi:hypothetical protein